MLSISNSQSLNSFQGLKKAKNDKTENKEVKQPPKENKTGKTAAVLASFALASALITGGGSQLAKKSEKPIKGVEITVSQESTASNSSSKKGIPDLSYDKESGKLTVKNEDGSEVTYDNPEDAHKNGGIIYDIGAGGHEGKDGRASTDETGTKNIGILSGNPFSPHL